MYCSYFRCILVYFLMFFFQGHSELAMRKVFKPHNGAVTCMAIDGKGEVLATASDDNTVFFFFVADDFKPIGFVNIPAAALSLKWSPEKNVRFLP